METGKSKSKPEFTLLRQPDADDLAKLFKQPIGRDVSGEREAGDGKNSSGKEEWLTLVAHSDMMKRAGVTIGVRKSYIACVQLGEPPDDPCTAGKYSRLPEELQE